MKNFRSRQQVGWFLGAWLLLFCGSVVANPSLSSLKLSPGDEPSLFRAELQLGLEGQNYLCQGEVAMDQFSILVCGERREAQMEWITFDQNRYAVGAVYQPGRQQGYLFFMKKNGEGYGLLEGPMVLTPGFGSVSAFIRYVWSPMAEEIRSENVFPTLVAWLNQTQSRQLTISQLRDEVGSQRYRKYVPSAKKEVAPEVSVSEQVQEPEKNRTEQPEQQDQLQEPEPEQEVASPLSAEEDFIETESELFILPDQGPIPSERPDIKNQEKEEGAPEILERPDHQQRDQEGSPSSPRPETYPQYDDGDYTTVRVVRGGQVRVVRVPRSYSSEDDFFNDPPPQKRRVLRNPRGYNLKRLTLKEMEDLFKKGHLYYDEEP